MFPSEGREEVSVAVKMVKCHDQSFLFFICTVQGSSHGHTCLLKT